MIDTKEETLELIAKAKTGDKSALSRIVEENQGLIWSIVRRFCNRGYELEDLFQIGSIGMIRAVKNFDPSFNVKFSTYAVPMIMGEIKKFIRDDGMIKVSRELKDIGNKVNRVKEDLNSKYGREPTIKEISEILDISKEDILMALEANAGYESLNAGVFEDNDNISLIDRIGSAEERLSVDDKIMIKELIKSLNKREQKIIMLRYYKEKTQSEVARALGISQVQVSRIEKKILSKMREKVLTN